MRPPEALPDAKSTPPPSSAATSVTPIVSAQKPRSALRAMERKWPDRYIEIILPCSLRVKQFQYTGLILLYQPVVIFSSKPANGGALSTEKLFTDDRNARQHFHDGQPHQQPGYEVLHIRAAGGHLFRCVRGGAETPGDFRTGGHCFWLRRGACGLRLHHDHAAAGLFGQLCGADDGIHGAGHAGRYDAQLQICRRRARAHRGRFLRAGNGRAPDRHHQRSAVDRKK